MIPFAAWVTPSAPISLISTGLNGTPLHPGKRHPPSRRQERGDQLGHQRRGAAFHVPVGVEFGDFHGQELGFAALFGQQGEQGLGLQAAGFRAADAGRLLGVEHVQVDAEAVAAGGLADDGQGLGEAGLEAALFQLGGGDHPDPQARQELGLFGFVAAHAEEDGVFGAQFGAGAAYRQQAFVADAQQAGQGHAVQGAAVGGLQGVAVHVGVEPEQAGAAGRAQVGVHAAPGADGAGVVAADDHGQGVGRQGVGHVQAQALAQVVDLGQGRFPVAGAGEQGFPPVQVGMVGDGAEVVAVVQRYGPLGAVWVAGAEAAGDADDADFVHGGGGLLELGCMLFALPAGLKVRETWSSHGRRCLPALSPPSPGGRGGKTGFRYAGLLS